MLEKAYELIANQSSNPPIGLTTAVIYDQEIVHWFSQGITNISNPYSIPDLDTIYMIGSVSKIFPAIETFQLRDQGIYRSLDDPLSEYANSFSIRSQYNNGNPSTAPITIRSMLCHMSGLPRQTTCEVCGELCPGVNPSMCDVTSDWIFNETKKEFVVLPPYTRPLYSNLGFALLGRVPELISFPSSNSSIKFEDYVEEFITTPMNISSTGFIINEEVYEKMAEGYGPPPHRKPIEYEELVNNCNNNWEAPAGQGHSSVRDLSSIVSSFLLSQSMINSPILSATTMKEMLITAYLDWDGSTLMSYPWESFFIDNYIVRCKAGNTNGFSGFLCMVPEMKLGFVTLTNVDVDCFMRAVPAMEILIPAFYSTLLSLPPPIRNPPNININLFEGIWVPVNSSHPLLNALSIYQREGALYFGPPPINDLLSSYNVTMYWMNNDDVNGDVWFQCIYPNGSPSRLGGGSCQNVELAGFQYKTMVFNKDLSLMMFPSVGGQYVRYNDSSTLHY